MMDAVQIVSSAVSVGLLLLVVQLVRHRRLAPDYGLVWACAALVLLLLSVRRGLLHVVAGWLHVSYPPSVLLLGLVLGTFVAALSFSIALSRHRAELDRLAEELALLRDELREARRAAAPRDGGDTQVSPTELAAAGDEPPPYPHPDQAELQARGPERPRA